MQLHSEMTQGLGILEPFLLQHSFEFDSFENFKSTSGQFTLAKYKNKSKEFILGYDFSIGQVIYQFDHFSVSHDFYIDKLGFTNQKKFTDVQTEDKLIPFKHIRHDFEYLVEDFFIGDCIRLKEISRFHDNIITEYNKIARRKFNLPFDNMWIEKARQEFRKKDFENCLVTYEKVISKDLINNLDVKIIEYCRHQIL